MPRSNGRFVKWSERDYNEVYSNSAEIASSDIPKSIPRDEFVEYVKENHTAESNLNEVLVAETIDFAGRSLRRKEEIAATVADNFTKEEIRKMTVQGDLTVVHGEKVVDKANADGAHGYRSGKSDSLIELDNDADKTAITHEFVHHLRVEDSERTGTAKTAYDLDKDGCVISGSKNEDRTFAEECAVIAETEIRTKERTSRPNKHLFELDRQPTTMEQEKQQSVNLERSTMRTKKHAIKPGELVPVFVEKSGSEVLSEGTNLRGKRAIKMFKTNFRRSRLGNAHREKISDAKKNIEILKDEAND